MRLNGLVLAFAVLGVGAVAAGKGPAVDRHCDYTRPGAEPWWSDGGGEVGESPLQRDSAVDTQGLQH